MGSFFDYPALVHDEDPVGFLDGGETMGDDEGRPVLHQPVERVLNGRLGFVVERRGGFI